MGSLVSLVMTDIVDSTRRWNSAEGAMAADLEHHDRLLADVVGATGGRVFKHTGDGMIAVFDDPVAAVTAAAGIQRSMGDTAWQHPDGLRVRAAVHTGVVYPRDGDLFGTAVNKLARILATCPPGAVHVSGATTALLTDRAPEGLTLQAIGPVTLPGFATPEPVHTLTGPGLTSVSTPTPTTAAAPARTGLPPIHDELIGRADELAAIWDAIGRSQLVTLVGVGGMGKTRLALEVAAGHHDTAWWIDLANATSADAVIAVAMAAVDARETPGRTPLQALCDRFATTHGLVVVDNCEHVHSAARTLIDALRTTAPAITIVATSREALGLRGEHLQPIGSLPGADGTALFTERALAVRPDLDTDTNTTVIERICTRLDGIPLAIELAAARCRSMTPTEIDTRLGERFRLLRGGRDGAERHRTLQAAVAWSYGLLDEAERNLFDQLAVFAGGTLIDGIEAVTGLDDIDALDIIDRLVARSMVVATTTPLGTRYHQLETLRQYAEDRLIDAGTITDTQNRHLAWIERLAAGLARARGVDAEAAAFVRLAADLDNLRTAVNHAVGRGHLPVAQNVVAMIGLSAYYSGALEVLDWVPRPPDGTEWTPVTAWCAALQVMVDAQRGRGFRRAADVDDVPSWYDVAFTPVKTAFVFTHSICGGDWRVALELLDRCEVSGEGEAITLDSQRLLATHFREQTSPLDDAGIEQVVALAAAATERARRSGSAVIQANLAINCALALGLARPVLASAYAQDGLDLANRLGTPLLGDYAAVSLAMTTRASDMSDGILAALRDRARSAFDTNQPFLAGSLLWAASPAIGRREPDVVRRFLTTWRREVGSPGMRFLEATMSYTDGAGGDETELSLRASITEMLDALDRLIAEPGSGAGTADAVGTARPEAADGAR
jgi:predicted ATPase/class 3 adenylate cyclase